MRVDLFGVHHKGIRALLFELSLEVGRADVTSAKAIDDLAARIDQVLDLLGEHASHEDSQLLPVLRRVAPGLAASLASDHATLEDRQAAVVQAIDALALAGLADRAVAGGRVQRTVDQLVIEHLHLMIRKETEVNTALWAALDDAALGAMRVEIKGEWLRILDGALNPAERRLVVEGRVE
jgi:hypothetical protein